jgi:hypothetical protein
MVGSLVVPVGMFMFAWTTFPWVHWIAPIIGSTILVQTTYKKTENRGKQQQCPSLVSPRQLLTFSSGTCASEPEFRLPAAMVGSLVVPVGMFMFAWTTFPWVMKMARIMPIPIPRKDRPTCHKLKP